MQGAQQAASKLQGHKHKPSHLRMQGDLFEPFA